MTEVDCWFSNNIYLVGKFRLVDESFDHAHGIEYRKGWELVDLKIYFYDDGIEHEVTKAFTDDAPKCCGNEMLYNYKIPYAWICRMCGSEKKDKNRKTLEDFRNKIISKFYDELSAA